MSCFTIRYVFSLVYSLGIQFCCVNSSKSFACYISLFHLSEMLFQIRKTPGFSGLKLLKMEPNPKFGFK